MKPGNSQLWDKTLVCISHWVLRLCSRCSYAKAWPYVYSNLGNGVTATPKTSQIPNPVPTYKHHYCMAGNNSGNVNTEVNHVTQHPYVSEQLTPISSQILVILYASVVHCERQGSYMPAEFGDPCPSLVQLTSYALWYVPKLISRENQ